jgi:hypothetical protein
MTIGRDDLGRLVHLERMRDADLECARHSGIPPRCAWFYLAVWLPRRIWRNGFARMMRERVKPKANRRAYYVQCPACLMAGRVVRVRRCPDPKVCKVAKRAAMIG